MLRWSRAPASSRGALEQKAREFASILKVGRTHLQDAVPITLGDVFGGYAACIERGADDVEAASQQLTELNLGATAVGTGLERRRRVRRTRRSAICGPIRTCRCGARRISSV